MRAFLLLETGRLQSFDSTVPGAFIRFTQFKNQEIDMKTVSIDAVRQRRVEIEGKIAIVIAAAQAINDRAVNEKRDLTEAEQSDFLKQTEAMKPLKAALARETFFLEEIGAQLERSRWQSCPRS